MMLAGGKIGYLHKDLGAFRVHGASITGSQRLASIFAKDSERINRLALGKDPTITDKIWGLTDRTAYFLRHPGEIIHTLRYRVLGRPQ
jgi:hypothetical protein